MTELPSNIWLSIGANGGPLVWNSVVRANKAAWLDPQYEEYFGRLFEIWHKKRSRTGLSAVAHGRLVYTNIQSSYFHGEDRFGSFSYGKVDVTLRFRRGRLHDWGPDQPAVCSDDKYGRCVINYSGGVARDGASVNMIYKKEGQAADVCAEIAGGVITKVKILYLGREHIILAESDSLRGAATEVEKSACKWVPAEYSPKKQGIIPDYVWAVARYKAETCRNMEHWIYVYGRIFDCLDPLQAEARKVMRNNRPDDIISRA